MMSFRKLKEVDMVKFKEDPQISFDSMELNGHNFKSMYSQYDDASRRVVDQHSPLVSRRVGVSREAWMDSEYRNNRAKRRMFERKWKKRKTEENRINYINQKEVCTQLAMSKQTAHYTKLVENASGSQNSLFKLANKLLDKKNEKILPTHNDPQQLANDFNSYFIEKVKNIRESIPNVERTNTGRLFTGEKLTVFKPTTEEEIKQIISENGVKTCMEDPLPSKLMISSMDVVLPVLVKLVNQSLREGSMDGVNWSVVGPLLKKLGLDSEVKKNYRPVNNLLPFSKLTEGVVSIRLDEHMDVNSLHERSQFAYKKHHNTEILMLNVTDEAIRGFDNNMATIVVFLDLSAAFDTIDIDKILQILEDEIGIGGVALHWFRSFLTGRTQRVKISGVYSESCDVPFGAPQGSVLGPKLFNINVRSQPLVFKQCSFNSSSFADDSNGRRSFAISFQFEIISNEVPKCIDRIIHWSHEHFMKINPEKTEIVLFRPFSLNSDIIMNGVLLGEQCIRFSKIVKNVGVWLDENLTLDKHINSVVSHSHKILRDIGRVKKYMQRTHLEQLIHAVISHLDYCNSLFINVSKDNLFKLQKLQNTAARIILGRRRHESASAALKELHWLNIDARITFKILLLVHKVVRGKCSLKLTYKSFNGRAEDELKLETPNFKTKYGKRLFEYNGSRLWNALPLHLRKEEDTEVYKKRIKTLLFDGNQELKRIAFKYQT